MESDFYKYYSKFYVLIDRETNFHTDMHGKITFHSDRNYAMKFPFFYYKAIKVSNLDNFLLDKLETELLKFNKILSNLMSMVPDAYNEFLNFSERNNVDELTKYFDCNLYSFKNDPILPILKGDIVYWNVDYNIKDNKITNIRQGKLTLKRWLYDYIIQEKADYIAFTQVDLLNKIND